MKKSLYLELDVDALEARQLLAGNVGVEVTTGGDLVIDGTQDDNQIKIVGEAQSGNYRIIGENGTRINGKNSIRVTGVTDDFRIDLNSGNNSLNLLNVAVADDLTIQANNGRDQIDLHNVQVGDDVTINLRGGNDTFVVYNTSIGDNLTLRTGDGNDSALAYLTNAGGNSSWQMGNGDDNLDVVDSNTTGNLRAFLRAGNDVANVENSLGVAMLHGGSGQDRLTNPETVSLRLRGFDGSGTSLQGVTSFVVGNVILDNLFGDALLVGDDTDNNLRVFGTPQDGLRVFGVGGTQINGQSNVEIGATTYFTAHLRGGNDRIGMTNGRTSRHVNIHGDAGNDRVDVDDFYVNRELAILTNGGNDHVSTAQVQIGRGLQVYTHDGADHVNAFETSTIGAYDHVVFTGNGSDAYWSENGFGDHYVHMGNDNDRLFMNNHFGLVTLVGGDGFDTINDFINGIGTQDIQDFEITDTGRIFVNGGGGVTPPGF